MWSGRDRRTGSSRSASFRSPSCGIRGCRGRSSWTRSSACRTTGDNWLLKPLFSYAGGGIIFAPTDADIEAIPEAERRLYVLQERIAFTPVIETPHGPTQAELRLMLVRDAGAYRLVLPLVRMGRGRMMGVDHNKGLAWVGASAALMVD